MIGFGTKRGSILRYYINKGYSPEEALALANPTTSKPNNSRGRRWFKKGVQVQTVPDKWLQCGTTASVFRNKVRFVKPGKK